MSNNETAFKLKFFHEKLPAFTCFTNTHVFSKYNIAKETVYKRNGLLTNFIEISDGIALDIIGNKPERILVIFIRRILVFCNDDGVNGQATKGYPCFLTIEEIGTIRLFDCSTSHGVVV